MKCPCIPALIFFAAASAAWAAPKYSQRWNYVGAELTSDNGLAKFLEVLKLSREACCTHILMPESASFRIPDNRAYLKRVAKVKEVAKELNLIIIPTVYHFGYSGTYLGVEPDLAAGLPVKDEPFLVSGGKAQVDPALAIDCSHVKADEDGHVSVKLKARPYTHYSIRFTLKQGYKGDADEMVRVTTCGGKRWVARTHPITYECGGKLIAQTTFNTLELDGGEMRLQITPACENVKIEPVGMWRIVRRVGKKQGFLRVKGRQRSARAQ